MLDAMAYITGYGYCPTCDVTDTSLNVGLRAGYLSVHTAGGASDRCFTEGAPYKWTDLLTYLILAGMLFCGLSCGVSQSQSAKLRHVVCFTWLPNPVVVGP